MMLVKHLTPILLVGTGHWANPGRDFANPYFDDMLSEHRQAEIADVVDRLASFAPTKIAVEYPAVSSPILSGEYQRFLDGSFGLTAAEQYQLGFRIAAIRGHTDIFAIDWNEGKGDLEIALDFAARHQPEIKQALNATHAASVLGEMTVREQLLHFNSAEALESSHRWYLTFARVGTEGQYLGVDWVKGWYERNLIIFVNLTRLICDPGDRLLVIYGAGHIPLLREFANDSGLFDIVDPEDHLR